ncbi:hypothetical protein [Pseudomonas corrugata]|uniref:hypothetical protein n=1 Tax=Pseudomonas corrugata TaxID=47879 RepID=UPI001586A804|nr:hypothetical protein [Pseudomonas corrugata]MCI0998033.1 hypothetical protein [Pseudomonas corrugata]NUT64727.1 hypothetical protein [Pseudomonas corrugata]
MYAPESCNPYAKVFYRPIEAAIRWCNLMAYESRILELTWRSPITLKSAFPQWPCLHANVEMIFDAIQYGELPYGCLGVSVAFGTPVDHLYLTVRHTDLKLWMSRFYPEQKPGFLFERSVQDRAVSISTYLTLQADRDALQLKVKSLETAHQKLLSELEAVGLERENIHSLFKTNSKVSDRSEAAYLHIIGAMVSLFLGHSPSGKPHSVFRSQAAIVDALTAHYKNLPGLSKRTLDEKFAAAKRSLSKR